MLTSKKIAALKPRAKRFQITDQFGLALRVQTSGVKSWVLRVPQNGRIVDITIGHWPEISLILTRGHARERIGRFCFGTRSIAEVKTKAKRLGVPAPSRLKEG